MRACFLACFWASSGPFLAPEIIKNTWRKPGWFSVYFWGCFWTPELANCPPKGPSGGSRLAQRWSNFGKIGSRFSPKSKIEPKSPFWSLLGPFLELFYEFLVIYLHILQDFWIQNSGRSLKNVRTSLSIRCPRGNSWQFIGCRSDFYKFFLWFPNSSTLFQFRPSACQPARPEFVDTLPASRQCRPARPPAIIWTLGVRAETRASLPYATQFIPGNSMSS